MNNAPNPNSPRATAEKKYVISRQNLLMMIILTAVNILLLFVNADYFLLFSATIPYLAAATGLYASPELGFGSAFVAVLFGFAVLCILAYVLCWILSKKHYGWMIAALVMFAIDTGMMALMYIAAQDVSGILDVLIHAWVLYYLIIGVVNGHKLKILPEEAVAVPEAGGVNPFANTESNASAQTHENLSTAPLRYADESVKARILLETEFAGHRIVYRRVKRTNELIVDSHVYDEAEMLVETAHTLNARVYGYDFQAGYDGMNSFICVNGERVAKKLRLW